MQRREEGMKMEVDPIVYDPAHPVTRFLLWLPTPIGGNEFLVAYCEEVSANPTQYCVPELTNEQRLARHTYTDRDGKKHKCHVFMSIRRGCDPEEVHDLVIEMNGHYHAPNKDAEDSPLEIYQSMVFSTRPVVEPVVDNAETDIKGECTIEEGNGEGELFIAEGNGAVRLRTLSGHEYINLSDDSEEVERGGEEEAYTSINPRRSGRYRATNEKTDGNAAPNGESATEGNGVVVVPTIELNPAELATPKVSKPAKKRPLRTPSPKKRNVSGGKEKEGPMDIRKLLYYASQLTMQPTPTECVVQSYKEFDENLPPVEKGTHCKTPFPPGEAQWEEQQIIDVQAMMDAICLIPRSDYRLEAVEQLCRANNRNIPPKLPEIIQEIVTDVADIKRLTIINTRAIQAVRVELPNATDLSIVEVNTPIRTEANMRNLMGDMISRNALAVWMCKNFDQHFRLAAAQWDKLMSDEYMCGKLWPNEYNIRKHHDRLIPEVFATFMYNWCNDNLLQEAGYTNDDYWQTIRRRIGRANKWEETELGGADDEGAGEGADGEESGSSAGAKRKNEEAAAGTPAAKQSKDDSEKQPDK
jgi:hypothetical protein